MKHLTRILAFGALLSWAVATPSTPSHAAGDGKTLFVENKCNSCHTISAQGVRKAKGDEEENGKKPPDLSHVGKEQNARWIKGYLMKTETLNGKKHKKAWKGSDADLTTLADWLASLK